MVTLRKKLQQIEDNWLKKRVPASERRTLDNRSLFVFPNRWGVVFGLLTLVVLITGINYQNAMISASAYLLIAMCLLHIFQSYKNLAGLTLEFDRAESAFPGDWITVILRVHAGDRERKGILVGWLPDRYARFNLDKGQSRDITVRLPAKRRGVLEPGRLLVATSWPLGLVTVWSRPDLSVRAWVYPEPVHAEPLDADTQEGGDQDQRRKHAYEGDFAGLREYQKGESVRRIVWKKFAQTGARVVRDFEVSSAKPEWVDASAWAHLETERKLSAMCEALLALYNQHKPFGLRIEQTEYGPDAGEAQLRRCLLSLAQYEGR